MTLVARTKGRQAGFKREAVSVYHGSDYGDPWAAEQAGVSRLLAGPSAYCTKEILQALYFRPFGWSSLPAGRQVRTRPSLGLAAQDGSRPLLISTIKKQAFADLFFNGGR